MPLKNTNTHTTTSQGKQAPFGAAPISEAATCERGSFPLFCSTWHTCQPDDERQRNLDAWSERHNQPIERLRVRPNEWDNPS